ncbi:hypothetical protein I552_2250 [Mycobacterium xenopi 3993]|nr:hypothetical protein I552_2250 [Mycobacterium xenopi 3993]
MPDPDLGGVHGNNRVDPQAWLFGELDDPDHVWGCPPRHQRLTRDDVAKERAFAASLLEMYGPTGESAAFQWG